MWGGLTPPAYRDLHDAGINTATCGFTLALLGGLGIFYLPAALPARLPGRFRAQNACWIAVAIAVALAATLCWPTSYTPHNPGDEFFPVPGRWGGPLWELVRLAPAVGGRSIVLPPLAVLGALILLALSRAAASQGRGRSAALLLLGLLAFVAAQSVNSQCWQRYIEPVVIVTLAWLAALAAGADPPRRWWWAGPAALAALQLALSAVSIYRKVWLADG
jgi:hypothetical protein